MKTFAILTTLTTLFLTTSAHAAGNYCPVDDGARPHASAPVSSRTQATLLIQGMRTASCPVLVKAALEKLKGVVHVDVDGPKKLVTVTYDPSTVSLQQIQATIKDKAGFDSKAVN